MHVDLKHLSAQQLFFSPRALTVNSSRCAGLARPIGLAPVSALLWRPTDRPPKQPISLVLRGEPVENPAKVPNIVAVIPKGGLSIHKNAAGPFLSGLPDPTLVVECPKSGARTEADRSDGSAFSADMSKVSDLLPTQGV